MTALPFLPLEVIEKVVSFLPLPGVRNCMLVCKQWKVSNGLPFYAAMVTGIQFFLISKTLTWVIRLSLHLSLMAHHTGAYHSFYSMRQQEVFPPSWEGLHGSPLYIKLTDSYLIYTCVEIHGHCVSIVSSPRTQCR